MLLLHKILAPPARVVISYHVSVAYFDSCCDYAPTRDSINDNQVRTREPNSLTAMAELGLTVAEFLQSAASLHRRFVADGLLGVGGQSPVQQPRSSIEPAELGALIRQFQGFVDRFALPGANRDEHPKHTTLGPFIKACRKVSQDIVIRFQQSSATPDGASDDWSTRLQRVFPARDVEVLGTRLLELKDCWATLRVVDE